jgi:uncharacterized protein (DUF1499 family)
MKILLLIVVLALVVVATAYTMLEKRPGYGAYYGLAKLTGSPLDIGPVDFATLTRHTTPNDALVCPAARCPKAKPDSEPKIYPMMAGDLLARIKKIALAEPDTSELSCDPNCDRTARLLQHTRLMRFPDTIDVEVFPVGDGQSTFAIYSRSLIGRGDMGVNRARITRWLTVLDGTVRSNSSF